MDGELALLPPPRHVELAGEGPGRGAEEHVARERALPAQGYELVLEPGRIWIRHADAAGLRYARATLGQIREQRDALPGLRIRDWPDYPVRGYMLDISRDRVPTRETLERIVDWLDLLRINHLELYTEHTFAYRDHTEVWRAASPITPDDVRWLDGLCRERGIELAANQNCFGHMARWLAHERYRPLAEAPQGWEPPWGGRRAPGVLAPGDEAYDFVAGLLDELLPNFASKRVNVNCDETFELGQGRSREDVAARGSGRVYLDFLRRILDGLRSQGYEALFWGDILRSHPELIPELPSRAATALVWHYEAPVDPAALPPELLERLAGFGVTEETLTGFAGQVRPFAESDYAHWVCPGTSSWNSLVGRWSNAHENLRDAARVGLGSGASGYLITDWGDNGHLQPPSVSLLPLAYGAALAWCADAAGALDVPSLLDRFVFRDDAQVLGGALEELGGLYARVGRVIPNGSALFHVLVGGSVLGGAGAPDPDGVKSVLASLAEISAAIGTARPRCSDGAVVCRELIQAARLAALGAGQLADEAGLSGGDPRQRRAQLDRAIAEQRACWLLRSRPGGLDDSVARLERARGHPEQN